VFVPVLACGGTTSESPAGGPSEAEIVAAAQTQLAHPGRTFFTTPSSLPGVSTWTAHFGPGGVSIIGDEATARSAALLFEMDDAANVRATVCTVVVDLHTDCSAVRAALASDFHASRGSAPTTRIGTSAPAALHILDEVPNPSYNEDYCKDQMGTLIFTLAVANPNAKGEPQMPDSVPHGDCYKELPPDPSSPAGATADPNNKADVGYCKFGDNATMAGNPYEKAPLPTNIAMGCCPAFNTDRDKTTEGSQHLVGDGVDLLVPYSCHIGAPPP
jgi:hypothetical protein